MKVGIAIPVHNRRDTTLQALGSIARADMRGLDVKVFIVDDGSTDGTAEAIARTFPGVQIVPGDGTLHYAGGTNRGMSAAIAWGADHVVMANDDAIFHEAFLQRLVQTAVSHPKSVVGALLLLWNQPHRVFQVGLRWRTWYGGWQVPEQLTAFTVPSEPWEVEVLVGNCVLVPAAAIRAHGLLDERRFPHGWGDVQYMVRLRRGGWNLLVDPRARVWCEPNTNPPPLSTRTAAEVLHIFLRNSRHPMNLRRQFVARWHSAPSRLEALAAFSVFVARMGLKAAGAGGTWPAWPDPAAVDR
jgi:GT2 family glycosyltransferase